MTADVVTEGGVGRRRGPARPARPGEPLSPTRHLPIRASWYRTPSQQSPLNHRISMIGCTKRPIGDSYTGAFGLETGARGGYRDPGTARGPAGRQVSSSGRDPATCGVGHAGASPQSSGLGRLPDRGPVGRVDTGRCAERAAGLCVAAAQGPPPADDQERGFGGLRRRLDLGTCSNWTPSGWICSVSTGWPEKGHDCCRPPRRQHRQPCGKRSSSGAAGHWPSSGICPSRPPRSPGLRRNTSARSARGWRPIYSSVGTAS